MAMLTMEKVLLAIAMSAMEAKVLLGVAVAATPVDAKVDLQTQRANTRIDIQSVPVDLTC